MLTFTGYFLGCFWSRLAKAIGAKGGFAEDTFIRSVSV